MADYTEDFKAKVLKAINGAIATKGVHKGYLKVTSPPMNTPEASAWQAITSVANPYKVGMAHMLFMTAENRLIYDAVLDCITRNAIDVRHLDRDRKALENLGVW